MKEINFLHFRRMILLQTFIIALFSLFLITSASGQGLPEKKQAPEEDASEFALEDESFDEDEEFDIELQGEGQPHQAADPNQEPVALDEELGQSASAEEQDKLPENFLVEQEYIAIRRTERIEDTIPPYSNRRSRWGVLFGLSAGFYTPDNYAPNFAVGQTFDEIYGGANGAVFEANIAVKLNMALGALTAGVGAGYYSIDNGDGDTSLTIIPVRLEGSLMLDTLFGEPLLVPYVFGGMYVAFFDEVQAETSFNGNTTIAPYFGGGMAFQLDWIDKEAALGAYLDYGLENTFLFFEVRQYLASASSGDSATDPTLEPDLSTSLSFYLGAKLEY